MAAESRFMNYLQSRREKYGDRTSVKIIRVVAFVVIFILCIIGESQSKSPYISGILAQIQVLTSVYVVINVIMYGYLSALAINLAWSGLVAYRVLFYKEIDSIPGMIIPISTVVIITFISFSGRFLHMKIEQTIRQTTELEALNRDLAVKEKELASNNVRLTEYTRILQDNEEKLYRLTNFDPVTELPNREKILSQMVFLTSIFAHQQMTFSLIMIDLDNFKVINDSLGHNVGDMMLKAVAARLKDTIHPDDMLGRMGGDEYAVIVQRQISEKEILNYVEILRVSLLSPFVLVGGEYSISASFGITLYPQDGTDAADLLKCADTALNKAKDVGRNGVQFFRKEMKSDILDKVTYETSLLSSIQNGELFLLFQPIYGAAGKELRSFETLVRWQSPKFGLVSPSRFISVAESAGFIIPMGEWILRTACRRFKDIGDRYGITPILSVNISAIQIMSPTFVKSVRTILAETGFDPHYLEFEITESVFISSVDYVVNIINELKGIGIRFALDDFGTGYSSLRYLQMLPIDTLKIDKSFVDSISLDGAGHCLVASIISLVHQMNMVVVAEGVDSSEKLRYLSSNGCDYVQGYIWGTPLRDEEMDRLIEKEVASDLN
jgi:diguanylate cyclase (GGDEF)-like protein